MNASVLMQMTVSSSARPSALVNPILFLNIILLGLCLSGLAYYVSSANSVASKEYYISSLRSKITQLTEQQSILMAEKTSAENPAAAAQFAQAQNMVSAQDIYYIFENGTVALQR